MPRERRAGGGIDRLPSGRYRVRIVTPDGRRLSLGTHPTRRAAEAAYARSVTEQADGKRTTPSAVTTPTLGDYASGWVDTRLTKRGEPLRPRVKDLYLMQLRLHIVPTFGTTRLARITTAQVRDWNARLRGPDGPGASTAAKCYRLLRSILTTAVEDGLIPANPCTVKGAGVEPGDERPIPSVAQVHDLVEQLPERMRCVVLLAAFVGLRRGEILGLRRGDVDLDRGEIAIVRQRQLDRYGAHLVGPPKSDAGRRVLAIPAALVADLRGHLEAFAQPGDDGYVFTGQKGGPLAPHVWQDAWEKARTEIGVPEIHLHDLRHLAGTLAASTGASTKEVMYRLGHATHQAALRYQHATRQRDRTIAESLDELLRLYERGERRRADPVPTSHEI
jgi:integrase